MQPLMAIVMDLNLSFLLIVIVSEQDKGVVRERKGRKEGDRKAGTQSGMYRHREEKNAREQAREIVEK